MIVPEGIEDLSDEQALVALRKAGYDKEAAEFVLSIVRGEYEGEEID